MKGLLGEQQLQTRETTQGPSCQTSYLNPGSTSLLSSDQIPSVQNIQNQLVGHPYLSKGDLCLFCPPEFAGAEGQGPINDGAAFLSNYYSTQSPDTI